MKAETVHQLQALIRGRRHELGLTQGETAARAGVSRKWVSDFERGATLAVELPQLLRVLAGLSLSMDIVDPDVTALEDAHHEDHDLDRLLNDYLDISDAIDDS